MASDKLVAGGSAVGYFVIFICSCVALGSLGDCKKEQENSSCQNWNDGYTPCPLTLNIEEGLCSTNGNVAPCDWVFTVGSLSAMLAFCGMTYHGLWFLDMQPNVTAVEAFELGVGGMFGFFMLSAAAVTTDKIGDVCDSISDSAVCGSDCESKFKCVEDSVPGYKDLYKRLITTQDSLWVATVVWIGLAVHAGYLLNTGGTKSNQNNQQKSYGV